MRYRSTKRRTLYTDANLYIISPDIVGTNCYVCPFKQNPIIFSLPLTLLQSAKFSRFGLK
jgi:hypothetical protein